VTLHGVLSPEKWPAGGNGQSHCEDQEKEATRVSTPNHSTSDLRLMTKEEVEEVEDEEEVEEEEGDKEKKEEEEDNEEGEEEDEEDEADEML